MRGHVAHAEQHPGHERRDVGAVVAQREGLPEVAEEHLLAARPGRAGAPSAPGCPRPCCPGRRRGSRVVASGIAPRPAAARACAIARAVAAAVPEGASTLRGWCSSTISADSKKRAACAAKRIMSTAPMAKFGATSTPVLGLSASQERTRAYRSSSQPVVPTTAWMPWRTSSSTSRRTDVGVGEVDDHLAARVDQRLDAVVLVDGRDELEVVSGLHRGADRRSDATEGPDDADACGHGPTLALRRRPRTRSRGRRRTGR